MDEGSELRTAAEPAVSADQAGSAVPAGSTASVEEVGWPDDLDLADEPILEAVTARLREVRDLPPAEHAAVYQDIHRGLQASLAEVDGA